MAIHDAGRGEYFVHSPISGFKSFSGLLRLSTKYDVDHIRSRMITIFTSLYPSTLVTWVCRKPPLGYKESDRDDFEALNLALELQILPVLPGIYYECARHTTANVFSSPISDVEKEKCISSVDKFNRKWCRRVMRAWFHLMMTAKTKLNATLNVFIFSNIKDFQRSTRFIRAHSPGRPSICVSIVSLVEKKIYNTERIHLWNALPSLFGLSAWTELLAG
ncbi:hypothetical protein C8R43DRAFT_1060853 [Mycena crocata]|nr:hypothetical protein C8R43DRAFT_1060853 [Mycena crocata]